MVELEPLGGSNAAHSFAYWGERQEWLVALSKHRDSDAVDRSNWDVIVTEFSTLMDENDWAIETFSNWAVGWTEHLLVRPGSPAAKRAAEYAARLADYQILDEEAFGMLEYDEEWCVRCDSGMRLDHPLKRCHKFRSEMDASEIEYHWKHRREW